MPYMPYMQRILIRHKTQTYLPCNSLSNICPQQVCILFRVSNIFPRKVSILSRVSNIFPKKLYLLFLEFEDLCTIGPGEGQGSRVIEKSVANVNSRLKPTSYRQIQPKGQMDKSTKIHKKRQSNTKLKDKTVLLQNLHCTFYTNYHTSSYT